MSTATEQQTVPALRGAPWKRFVVVGDSIAEGLGEAAEGFGPESWALRVADALRREQPDLEYLNLGRRYLTAPQVRETQLRPALEFGPDLAAVVAGGNDLIDPGFDPRRLEADLDSLIRPLHELGADIITFELLDISRAFEMSSEFIERIEPRLATLAEVTRGLAQRYATIHVDMRSHPVSADPRIYSADRIHANTRGHAIVAAETRNALALRIAR